MELFIRWIVGLLVLSSSLCGGITQEQRRQYESSLERRLVQTEEGGQSVISALLDDGTLWDCYYYNLGAKQHLLYVWKPGDKMTFWCDGMRIIMGRSTNSYAHAYLDPSTAENLPYIVQVTSNGIRLSDGSEWKEAYWLFSVHHGWREGDRVLVVNAHNLTDLGSYTLYNLSHANFGVLTHSSYMCASLISLEP